MKKKIFFLNWPNLLLRKKSKIIKKIDNQFLKVFLIMQKILKKNAKILGISSIQIGVRIKMFVAKIYNEEKKRYFVEIFINPKIIKESNQEINSIESCLSIYGKSGIKYRKKIILISYFDINKKKKTKIFKNNNAICLQHEMDHINGILWID